MATGKPIIVCDGITKRFGTLAAVDAVDLTINEGEFFALLGPSGCGKTTLLRMMAGFEMPDGGRILIDGADVSTLPPKKRPVNMVFQSYAVFPHMTVAENVGYGLRVGGVPAAERKRRVEEFLALVKLEGYGGRKPDQLSGGQRQRVALARALIKHPRVLLLDEPLSALDAKLRDQMRAELAQLQFKIGITFVFVTHDQDEALAMADRVAVMNQGRLEQVARPAELYEAPNSRFVADFIGSVNLFECGLSRGGPDGTIVRSAELAGPIHLDRALPPGTPAPFWLAIRPETMTLARRKNGDAPPSDENVTAGTIRHIAYLGSETIFDVELGTGKRIKVLRSNLGRRDQEMFDWDDPVFVAWPSSAPVVLPK